MNDFKDIQAKIESDKNEENSIKDKILQLSLTSLSSDICPSTNDLDTGILYDDFNVRDLGFHSYLLVTEIGQVLKAITQSKNDEFLPPSAYKPQICKVPHFDNAFIEFKVETKEGKELHIIMIKKMTITGESGHKALYSWINKQFIDDPKNTELINRLKKLLGIEKIISHEEYAVTGECSGKVLKSQLKKKNPIYLSDLGIIFNTKGSLTDSLKPFSQFVSSKNLSEEELYIKLLEYNNTKLFLKACAYLITYIPYENWLFDAIWDLDLKLDSSKNGSRAKFVIKGKPIIAESDKITSSSMENSSTLQSNSLQINQTKKEEEAVKKHVSSERLASKPGLFSSKNRLALVKESSSTNQKDIDQLPATPQSNI